MPDNNDKPARTHNTRQRLIIASVFYGLAIAGIGFYIGFAEILYAPYLQRILADANNKYPERLYFLIIGVVTYIILYPLYWLVKKKLIQKDRAEYALSPLTGTNKKEFTFSSGGPAVTVSLGDTFMEVQVAFKTKTFAVKKLRNFYLYSTTSFSTLIITYEDDNGKIKKCNLPAIEDDEQQTLLNAELEKRFPERSLNALSDTEAFQEMDELAPGIKIALVIGLILLVIGIVAVVMYW